MIVWVKYGFENTPLKMYNMNVSSAILLSFLKATCIKDIDDVCKQKNIQLSIELDAIRRATLSRKSISASVPTEEPLESRPSSDLPPSTPNSIRRASNVPETLSEEDSTAKTKKAQLEKQLEIINAAAKLVNELIAGVVFVDLVDANGTRMNLDSVGNTRVNTLLTAREQYSAVAVSTNEFGDTIVTPLVFKLVS